MPEHDVIALQANFEAWQKDRAKGLKVEPFLYYTVENITKEYDLTDEEVIYGITDHPDDGGIDALYFMAGKAHRLIRDDLPFRLDGADFIRIMVFQAKSSLSSTGFSPDDIDAFARFADALLSIKTPAKQFSGDYHSRIITMMQTFRDRYFEVAGSFPNLYLQFYLVTRGDGEQLNDAGDNAVGRLRQAVIKHRGINSSDKFDFVAVETQKLREYVRQRRQRARAVRWATQPLTIQDSSSNPPRLDGYIGLVRLRDYYDFLKDGKGDLDELIFESNVRGHQGRSSVNRQMRNSLDDHTPIPDFWQLNNGITITCARVDPIDASSVQVHDPQVVNGLQTSRQIFAHCADAKSDSNVADQRSVLVKLMPIDDASIRDRIIRSTNNQNFLGASALRTTDERHREIEDLFAKFDLYYDRRPGYYKDLGKEIASIVSVNEVVQAVVALVLHKPNDARGRPGDYTKEGKRGDEKYKTVFGTKSRPAMPLSVYLRCVLVVRRVRDYLASVENLSPGDRTNLLFYVAYYAVCQSFKTATPAAESLLTADASFPADTLLESSLQVVEPLYRKHSAAEENPDVVARGTAFAEAIFEHLTGLYGASAPPRKSTRKRKPRDIIAESAVAR